jgi:hypothetical protein
MMGVLNPVRFDDFDLISDLDGEMHAVNRIALFDLFKQTGVPIREFRRFVETFFYGAKETVR